MQIDFDRMVEIVDWVDQKVVAILPFNGMPLDALTVMGNSQRFDVNHCTSSVRLLNEDEAKELGLDPARSVTFRFRQVGSLTDSIELNDDDMDAMHDALDKSYPLRNDTRSESEMQIIDYNDGMEIVLFNVVRCEWVPLIIRTPAGWYLEVIKSDDKLVYVKWRKTKPKSIPKNHVLIQFK